jgi:hypothetical protein
MWRRAAFTLLAALWVGHCAQTPAEPAATRPSPVDASLRSDPIGTWRGYIEHADFDDGTGNVELALRRSGTELTAKLSFGVANPEPELPITDAGGRDRIGIEPGFAYTGYRIRMEGERLRLHVELGDRVAEWCAAQRPRPRIDGTNTWGCPEHGFGRGSDGCSIMAGDVSIDFEPDAGRRVKRVRNRRQVPVDCELLRWCEALRDRCFCKENTCSAQPGARVNLDLVVRGDTAEGSIELASGVRNIRLRRVSP